MIGLKPFFIYHSKEKYFIKWTRPGRSWGTVSTIWLQGGLQDWAQLEHESEQESLGIEQDSLGRKQDSYRQPAEGWTGPTAIWERSLPFVFIFCSIFGSTCSLKFVRLGCHNFLFAAQSMLWNYVLGLGLAIMQQYWETHCLRLQTSLISKTLFYESGNFPVRPHWRQ